ncbi:hypothetical protein MKW92_000362 [Papaver armeniacum]|nr:hypothetical protein MKW92_000362 [Papaver armeniacum]
MGRSNEITRAKEEAEHWKLACLVVRNHNNELMLECSEVKKRLEEGFKEGTEISQKNVIVYKRKRDTDVLEDEQRDKCQQCVKLNWEIDDLKYENGRANEEIKGLKSECLELEVQGDLTNMSCNQLKAKIAILEAETSEREKIQQERISCLEKEYKKTECFQKDRCIQLNREIEDMKLGKKRQAVEIKDLKRKCIQLERRVTVSSNHETKLAKELEAYKTKCQGLSVEIERKGVELENLQEVNGALDLEREHYRTKCSEMEEQIKGLIEIGAVIYEREMSAGKRICHLEAVVKKMETDQDAYKIECQGLSAELKRKGVELENLREVNGAFDSEREHYRTKCSGMEEQIKGLIEGGAVMAEREISARERICHLEAVVKKMETDQSERCKELETRLSKVEEENSALRGLQNGVSCGKTCRQMDGRVDVAHLTRTETSPNSSFALSCKPPTLQVNFDGVPASDLALLNNLCKSAIGGKDYYASAAGHQVGFETEGRLTRFRKCSATPPAENLALLRQEDGARPSTTSPIVAFDSENEIVYISDSEG